jgi:hypothetical protein
MGLTVSMPLRLKPGENPGAIKVTTVLLSSLGCQLADPPDNGSGRGRAFEKVCQPRTPLH